MVMRDDREAHVTVWGAGIPLLLAIDEALYLRYRNQAADDWFGFDQMANDGLAAPSSLPAIAWSAISDAIKRLKNTGHAQAFGLTVKGNTKDTEFQVELSQLKGAGESLFIVAMVPETGRRHRTAHVDDQDVREAQRLESLGLMAGGVAHDFNNLLVAMLGYAELALESNPGDDVSNMLKEVVSAAERASELSDQLLAYSGRGKFTQNPVDLGEIASNTTRLLRASMPQNRQLFVSCEEAALWTEGDQAQLRQVLLNLVTNASDALDEEGGFINVRVNRRQIGHQEKRAHKSQVWLPAGDYIELTVEDDGCGMAEEVQKQIFDPFFTTKNRGRGLGLAATLGIVDAHGGCLEIDSELGRGTEFAVYLPASDWEDSEQPTPPPSKNSNLSVGQYVLVVDDNDTVRELARRVLKTYGFSVIQANSGMDALALLERAPVRVSVVLLDLVMPGMSGQETLAKIRESWPALPVVLTSGYSSTELALQDSPTESFIQKPFRVQALVESLTEAVRVGGMAQQSMRRIHGPLSRL